MGNKKSFDVLRASEGQSSDVTGIVQTAPETGVIRKKSHAQALLNAVFVIHVTGYKSHLHQSRAMVSNIEACDDIWVVSHGAGESLKALGFQGDYHVMNNARTILKGFE